MKIASPGRYAGTMTLTRGPSSTHKSGGDVRGQRVQNPVRCWTFNGKLQWEHPHLLVHCAHNTKPLFRIVCGKWQCRILALHQGVRFVEGELVAVACHFPLRCQNGKIARVPHVPRSYFCFEGEEPVISPKSSLALGYLQKRVDLPRSISICWG